MDNLLIMSRTGEIYFNYSSFTKPPEYLNDRHCHDKYEILYVINGSGEYVIEGAEYPIKPGTILFAPKASYHSIKLDATHKYERYVLQFDANLFTAETQTCFEALNRTLRSVGCCYSAEAISPSVISLFERFDGAKELPERERKEYMRLLTSEMILLLSVAKKEYIPRDEGELGMKVIKYLNEHIEKDVSLDSLAKKFFVSKYHLCRAFKKHNGISIHGYINQKRVIYAKQLIESGETASGAAYKVGFGDYSAFYRAYVKILGCSPTSQKIGKDIG